MDTLVTDIVVVGGGTAGWLAACRLAAAGVSVTLVESPDVATIGVGEGTWPTIRGTLQSIGITESDFLTACDASFKQGSRFDGWRDGADDDRYYHPFVPPPVAPDEAVAAWRLFDAGQPFAGCVSSQPKLCDLTLAPRQRAMPDYAGAQNYAYHLDAGKLAVLLRDHATGKLGVRHVRDHVTAVIAAEGGDIASVRTRDHGDIAGDLFIDCTGHAALLVGGHFGVPFIDRGHELFNDRALAVQVPVPDDSAIASHTNATAHAAGWIWDIGLPTRRGIGCVYASSYMSDAAANDVLEGYLRATAPWAKPADLSPRRLSFRSGHRERFWERNCLAIGQAAGFLEPLEASAIVMIELALDALVQNFPRTRAAMSLHAPRFNALFRYRWDRIVEFLKLHYVLSSRSEPYWVDHRQPDSVPPRLAGLLQVWRDQAPSDYDLGAVNEVFPAASYAYILYGMGFAPPAGGAIRNLPPDAAVHAIRQVAARTRNLTASLPTNRAYLQALRNTQKTPEILQGLKN